MRKYLRFSAAQRLQHMILLVVFIGLLLTGLPQMYPESGWADTIITLLDGIESTRIIHHVLGVGLILLIIYHLLDVFYRVNVLGNRAGLVPGARDFRDGLDWLRYNLGLKAERPRMPFYNFSEKWDYWLIGIGLIIMVVTGLMLWNPIAVTNAFSGEIIPTARTIHGKQALLLLILVGIGHLYNTIFKQFNLSMLTGRLTEKQMIQEHAEALDETPPAEPKAGIIPARRQRFLLVAVPLTVLLLGGLAWLLTFEDTAVELKTTSRQNAPIYMPGLDGGDAEAGAELWTTLRCTHCHGQDAGGVVEAGPAVVGTTLTFEEFYFQVREGRGDMHAFSREELSDVNLLNLWTWLHSEEQGT